MTMEICNKAVLPRNWTAYLHETCHSIYKPQMSSVNAQAHISFGYAIPLADAVALFEERNSSKNDPGSDYSQLIKYSGVFYYHQGEDPTMPARLTTPLEKTKHQTKTITTMATTHIRIVDLGYALIGCCRESYLVQGHNKSQYVASGSSSEQQHTIVTLQARVNDKMREYLNL